MDFHIERKLRLQMHPEKSLYSWAINEVDDDGKFVGRDQIPWDWSLYFAATEIILAEQISVKSVGQGEGRLPQKAEISHHRTIRAKLRPGDTREGGDFFRQTTFRMFGTNRSIEDFRLDIVSLESEEESETCRAWGSVAYTAEMDFRDETNDDCIIFYLTVKPSTFERYAERIASGAANEMIFAVAMVNGFYSGWSPSISTRDIKVLTGGREQIVDMPDGLEFLPPRLGMVGDADLYINTNRVHAGRLHNTEDVAHDGLGDSPLAGQQVKEANAAAGLDPDMAKLLYSLTRTARWGIFLLIVLVVATLLKS